MRCLERDIHRAVVDLGGESAHDPGEADDSRIVHDDEIVGTELADDVINGLQVGTLGRPTCSDPPRELVEVERMQWLAELEHDVVRDINGQRDRPHPAGHEATLHPMRRRSRRIEAGDRAHREQPAGAEVVAAAFGGGRTGNGGRELDDH